jgi:hypothetical protein
MDSSSFVVTEMSGMERTLELSGRALPFRPITFEGEQRSEVTHYPGNPIATMQVLGPSELSTTIKGKWQDRYLRSNDDDSNQCLPDAIAKLDGDQVADVRSLTLLVDDIRRQGQQIKVTWGHIARIGLLKKFTQTWQYMDVVEWEITFEWISQDDQESAITLSVGLDQEGLVADLNAQLDELTQMDAGYPVLGEFAAKMITIFDNITMATDEISDNSDSTTDAIITPQDSTRRIIAALETVKDESQSLFELMDAQPAQATISISGTLDSVTLGSAIEAADFCHQVKRVARTLRNLAVENSIKLALSESEQETKAIYTATENQDLRHISTLYFGTPNEWQRIMIYNGFSSSRLVAGQMVLIPTLNVVGN